MTQILRGRQNDRRLGEMEMEGITLDALRDAEATTSHLSTLNPHLKGFNLKIEARIWPQLSYMCHILSFTVPTVQYFGLDCLICVLDCFDGGDHLGRAP